MHSGSLQELCRTLGQQASTDLPQYFAAYSQNDAVVLEKLNSFQGVKTDVLTDLSAESIRKLKVSLLMSDLTSIYLPPASAEEEDVMISFGGEGNFSQPPSVTIDVKMINDLKLRIEDGRLVANAAYYGRIDDKARVFADEISGILDLGLAIIRPRPTILIPTIEEDENGEIRSCFLPIEPNLPESHGTLGQTGQSSIPFKDSLIPLGFSSEAQTIVMPYLDGISFADFAKVLQDEQDCVAAVRTSIRGLIKQAADPENGNLQELVNDTVRPSVDEITRKFKAVRAATTVKVGGTGLGLVTLALMVSQGFLPGSAGVTAALGVSGIAAALLNQYATYYQENKAIRDMPFYMLWRLKNVET